MVKEDRSDWVAVAPEHQASSSQPAIRPAASAYQLFQKDITPHVKNQLQASQGTFDVGQFSRAVRDRWSSLDAAQKAHYEDLARQDASRFAQESHMADLAALERQRQLQQERQELILDDEDGDLGKRSTRRARKKQMKKKERREKKARARKEGSESESDSEESFASGGSSSSLEDTSDSDQAKKKKGPAPRQMSQAMIERRERAKAEKDEKEAYIAQRQEDLRKDRAAQAKRRLDFLLAQSDIFKHFGQVKEDRTKFGVSTVASPKAEGGGHRRVSVEVNSAEADAADVAQFEEERKTTYLTSQPATLGHGKMRDYQLEGLNWMIRLQVCRCWLHLLIDRVFLAF
jgi:hypothetical protein